MPLVRCEVRSEYGLGDPELYRGPAKKEDSKVLLDGVAVAGLVGILRQLGDLAEFAADVFHDLHEQVTATASRGRKMLTRVKNIEAALPSLEKSIQCQTSHIHFAYVAGCDWHAHLQNQQSHLLSSELPPFMMDSYEECRDPPRLYLLDKFDSAGAGACLKRYSDPSYFKRVWAMSESEKGEHAQKEKKAQKIKRKGSLMRNGEIHAAVSNISRHNSSLASTSRFASPSTDTQSSLTENISTPDMRLNPELASESRSFGSKRRSSYVEQVSDMNLSVVPDDLEYDKVSDSKLHIEPSGAYASVLGDEPNGDVADNNSQHLFLSGAEKLPPGHANNATTSSESAQITGPLISMPTGHFGPHIQKECDDVCPSQDQPGQPCSPSCCVDAFLTDPLENCDNSPGSPDLCLKEAAEITQPRQADITGIDEKQMKCSKEDFTQLQTITPSALVKDITADCLDHSTSPE